MLVHTDERWAEDPFPIWDELRETCPVARTERWGGSWMPTRYDDIAAVAHDSSESLIYPSKNSTLESSGTCNSRMCVASPYPPALLAAGISKRHAAAVWYC